MKPLAGVSSRVAALLDGNQIFAVFEAIADCLIALTRADVFEHPTHAERGKHRVVKPRRSDQVANADADVMQRTLRCRGQYSGLVPGGEDCAGNN